MGESSLESPRELFERLQERIGAERARLASWQAIEAEYQRKYTQDLRPLEEKLNLLRYKLVLCFDHACKNMGLSKAEREFVSELVTEFSEELLGLAAKSDLPAGCDVARLKTLYKKHCGSDYDADVAEDTEQAKEYLAEALELDAGELDAYTPIRLLQLIQDQFEDEEAEELLEEARQALRSPVTNAQAWQAFQDAERERLAESAQDPALKAGVAGGDGLTGDALDKANAVLAKQLDEVLAQLNYAEEGFKLRYELDPFATFDPDTVIEELDADIVDIQEYIRELEHEVMQFSDESLLKAWLKAMRREVAAIERREGRS
ncbi:molecular chaperone DnaJ [Achromobacter sp.]|uniref:molecular chaperone DnaJ n=1 Tax=Achromobacter sp. TaxID=134375 RepID=UPI0028A7DFCD|nr:molecular chaperone DnaJ [Achromobacter sp.]